jgi:hypothetical protein
MLPRCEPTYLVPTQRARTGYQEWLSVPGVQHISDHPDAVSENGDKLWGGMRHRRMSIRVQHLQVDAVSGRVARQVQETDIIRNLDGTRDNEQPAR